MDTSATWTSYMYLVLLLSKNHRKELVCVSLDAVRDMNVFVYAADASIRAWV